MRTGRAYPARPTFLRNRQAPAAPPGTQALRPDADNAAGSWGTTPLWSKLDETTLDDADFITETLPGTSPVITLLGALVTATTGSRAITLGSAGQIDANDIIILEAIAYNTTGTVPTAFTWPSGFSEIFSGTVKTSAGTARGIAGVAWKRADGTEDATSVTTTHNGATGTSTFFGVQAVLVRGCVTSGNPWDHFQTNNPNHTTTVAWPSVTPTGDNRSILAGLLNSDNNALPTTPTNYGVIENTNSGTGTDGTVASFDREGVNAAGAPYTIANQTIANTNATGWLTYQISFQPPAPKVTSTAQLSLAAASPAPATQTNHKIVVRARKTNSADTGTIKARLYEGGTARSAELETSALTTSFVTYTLNVADADAANITSYANLEIRLFGSSSAASPTAFEVSWLYLEVPAGSGVPTTPIAISAGLTLTPAFSMVKTAPRAIAANLVLTAAMTRVKTAPRAIDANLVLTAALAKAKLSYRSIDAPLTLTATFTFGKAAPMAVSAGLTLTPTLTKVKIAPRAISAGLTLTPTLARVKTGFLAISATLNLTAALTKIKTAPRAISATLTLTPAITMIKTAPRAISASLLLTPGASAVKVKLQTVAAGLTLTPAITMMKVKGLTIAVSLTMTAALTKLKRAVRAVSAGLTLSAAQARVKTAPRQIDASLSLTASLSRVVTHYQRLDASLALQASLTRKRFVTLAVILSLTPNMTFQKLLPLRLVAINATLVLQAAISPHVSRIKNYITGVGIARPIITGARVLRARITGAGDDDTTITGAK